MKLIDRLEKQIESLQEVQSKLLHHESLGELEDWVDREFPLSSLDIDMQSMSVNLSGTKVDLEKMWAELRKRGWFLPEGARRPKDGEPSWCGFFRKEKDENLEDPQLIFLMFSSKVCRRVKVGERTVTEDIFETRCGDDPAPASSPAAYEPTLLNQLPSLAEAAAPEVELPIGDVLGTVLSAPAPATPEAFDDDIPF